jgi:hypothetical protein
VPITGRTLEIASATFRDHVNGVLARTVTATPLIMVQAVRPRGAPSGIQLAFRQYGAPIEAPLNTRFGRAGLYLGQTCQSTVGDDRLHRLRTVSYRYTLTPEGAREPLFRWEYEKTPTNAGLYCRHHIQGDVPLQFGRDLVPLNDLHLPTGFVTIEEVLRFCIVDLGVRPLSDDWHTILTESYGLFKGDFAPRGQL